MIVIRPATQDDAAYIGAHLRAEDEREVQTSTGLPGTQVVPLSFALSRECHTVLYKDVPCLLFGVADDPSHDRGVIWLLATDNVRHCAVSLIKELRPWRDHLCRHYTLGLFSMADARNALHVRWAKLMGFTEQGSSLRNGHHFIHISYSPCVSPPQ